MSRGRWTALVVAAVVVFLAAAGITGAVLVKSSKSRAVLKLPASMASAGDSITRAFDVDGAHLLRDAPTESWSTGSDPAVNSHYRRILTAQPALAGHVFNDARSGARMAALGGQLKAAAAQKVEYLTVLIGADDLCTATVAGMTPTAVFESRFDRALSDFLAADPGAHVLVSSIPDLFQLWDTLRDNLRAELTWGLTHTCPTMLSPTASWADRGRVVAQERADNAALAAVCRRYHRCRFDGGAVYRVRFTAADVSPIDFFHPSLTGQATLAAVTWAAGYWPAP